MNGANKGWGAIASVRPSKGTAIARGVCDRDSSPNTYMEIRFEY
ncbi:MAG TPA: hypothetical protein V6D12_04680 [Candidatus Obscuribacterales bacterium]